jgi:AcrR family transcriptional regulator
MPLQGGLSIEHLCRLVGVSRRSFYRSLQERQPVEEEMEVRSAIQQIFLEHRRRYGYRRITAELAAGECRSITNVWRGLCAKITC